MYLNDLILQLFSIIHTSQFYMEIFVCVNISLVWMTKFASTAQGNVKIVTMDSSAVAYIYVKELTPKANFLVFNFVPENCVFMCQASY